MQRWLDRCVMLDQMNAMREYLQNLRLPWFGHLERMEENAWSSTSRTFVVGDNFTKEWLRKTWSKIIRNDL